MPAVPPIVSGEDFSVISPQSETKEDLNGFDRPWRSGTRKNIAHKTSPSTAAGNENNKEKKLDSTDEIDQMTSLMEKENSAWE